MSYSIGYTHEFEDGTTQEWLVEFTISKFYPQTLYQPAEGGEVELISVTYEGKEVDEELIDSLYEPISEFILDNHDGTPDYYEE